MTETASSEERDNALRMRGKSITEQQPIMTVKKAKIEAAEKEKREKNGCCFASWRIACSRLSSCMGS